MNMLVVSGCSSNKQDIKFDENEALTQVEESLEVVDESTEDTQIYVYVCGQVNNPGVYNFSQGSRIYEAIKAAGDATKEARLEGLNLASIMADGDKIYVPGAEEAIVEDASDDLQRDASGLVNINTATVDELKTLPGIGDAKANAIVSYRESNGKFLTIDDVMKVNGIKESAFSKIKDLISVK